MNDLYLILHKVRGEPAFDIAQKMMIGEEEGWIIPTSGHRAYPIWSSDLFGLIDEGTGCHVLDGYLGHVMKNMPPDHPDHYNPKRDDGSHLINSAREILMRRGLISEAKPANTFRRA